MQPKSELYEQSKLYEKAELQLNICNACRYCEGYCAVFPALEEHTVLRPGTIDFLANLCHDCRACLYACPYAPPHDFGLDLPRTLSAVRHHGWKEDLPQPARWLADHATSGVAAAVVVAAALVVALAGVTVGLGQVWHPRPSAASPYDVISYPAIVAVMGAAFVYGIAMMAVAARRYWRRTGGTGFFSLTAWRGALAEAAYLHNLDGGGADCPYPTETPSPLRRHLHAAVAYGFLLCFVATVSAGIMQDILGNDPPYPLVSVPVLSGLVGGIALTIGTVGLLALKRRSDPAATDEDAVAGDTGFVAALAILAVTGLLTLLLRGSSAFGVVLVVHLAAVGAGFVLAPSSKFAHVPYRLLALVRSHLEP